MTEVPMIPAVKEFEEFDKCMANLESVHTGKTDVDEYGRVSGLSGFKGETVGIAVFSLEKPNKESKTQEG
jgi:hypothetical protein